MPVSNPDKDNPPERIQSSDSSKVRIVKAPNKHYGKNKFNWSGERGVLPKRNLVGRLPGNTNEAKHVNSALEAWQLCFTKENLDLITGCTKKEVEAQRSKYNKNMDDKNTVMEHLKTISLHTPKTLI